MHSRVQQQQTGSSIIDRVRQNGRYHGINEFLSTAVSRWRPRNCRRHRMILRQHPSLCDAGRRRWLDQHGELSRQLTMHVRWIVGATTDDGRPLAAVVALERPILVFNIASTIADDAEGRGAGYTTVECRVKTIRCFV